MIDAARTFDTSRPFTRAQAEAAGISTRALAGPRYTRIFYDVYVDADVVVDHELRARAALDVCPGSYLSHHSAAKRYGAWLPDEPDIHVSVRRRKDRRTRRGVVAHLAHPLAEVVIHRGLATSSPSQVFCEMARFLPLVELVVLGDSLVRRRLTSPEDLVVAAERWRGHRSRLARRAAALVRRGVESPYETRLRLLLVLAGLPEPVIGHEVTRPDGRRRIRFDLCWPGLRVAVEYDGRHHAESRHQWLHDIDRREDLDVLRFRLIVAVAEDIHIRPDVLLQRVVEALRAAGELRWRVAADDEWRRHFPGRPERAAA